MATARASEEVLSLKTLAPSALAVLANPVLVGPGQRAVTVTPVPFSSAVRASENDRT